MGNSAWDNSAWDNSAWVVRGVASREIVWGHSTHLPRQTFENSCKDFDSRPSTNPWPVQFSNGESD